MSAICGVIGLDGREFSAADLVGVRRNLRPLGESEESWEGKVGRCGVALGVTVSQWTPEDAFEQQPFWLAEGKLGIIADMRIDNRPELIAQLGLRDASKLPDSAVALAAYERWGEGFLDRIIGVFALAIVDRRRGGILLARDHVGDRPLVVHQRQGVVAFASNALALTALNGVGHEMDPRWASEILVLMYETNRTPVQSVSWLPRASAAWIDSGGLRDWRWWNPDPHGFDELDQQEHEERLRTAFDTAVSAMLRRSGEVCTFVSGGLDSTSVTATAARALKGSPLRTYTAAPPVGWDGPVLPGWDADESPLVADLSHVCPNLDSVVMRETDAGHIFTLQEPIWERGGAPLHNPCNALWISEMTQHAASDGFQVQLGGEGGNDFFSADGPQWLIALLRRRRIREAGREIVAWHRASPQNTVATARQLLGGSLPPRVHALLRKLSGRPSNAARFLTYTAIREEAITELELAASVPWLDDKRRVDPREEALDRLGGYAGQADSNAAMRSLWRLDRREPTTDRRVLDAAIRQPEWVRRHRGVSRAAARGAMADRLPRSIRQRTRRGAQLPNWLDLITREKVRVETELDAASEDPFSNQLIDLESLRTQVKRWPDRCQAADDDVVGRYRFALLRALLLSRYLRWFSCRRSLTVIEQAQQGQAR